VAPPVVQEVLRSPGRPLDAATRAFFEPRLGMVRRSPSASSAGLVVGAVDDPREREADRVADRAVRREPSGGLGVDLGGVRVHTDDRAAESAAAVGARAYAVGEHLVFGRGRYAPGSEEGRRLLAHELAHTIQEAGLTTTLRRDAENPSEFDRTPPTPAASAAGSECDDPDFCTPFATVGEAVRARNDLITGFLPALRVVFGEEVALLWLSYLSRRPGDSLARRVFSSPTSRVVQGFVTSDTTRARQRDLIVTVKSVLPSFCLSVPINAWTSIPVEQLLPRSVLEYPIDFDHALEIPGNIAGGVGSSDAGPDRRRVSGSVSLTRTADARGNVTGARLRTGFTFVVEDAIDFCPGQCGAVLEQLLATIKMSRLEASGFAYDVPFEVRFDGETVEEAIDPALVPPCMLGPPSPLGTALAEGESPPARPAATEAAAPTGEQTIAEATPGEPSTGEAATSEEVA
jgi:Domain of unknown function (DUF4157)